MDPKRNEFLNTAAFLGRTPREAARHDLPILRARAREQLRAALVLDGTLAADEVDDRIRALVERCRAEGVTAEQLRAQLRADRVEVRDLERIACGENVSVPPRAAKVRARTTSTPPRVTRREPASRPAVERDDGSGGEEPPSRAEVAHAMGEELIRSTREVRVAQGMLVAARAGVPCLAAPEGATVADALERARVALRAQGDAVRACLAAGVEPALPEAPRPERVVRLVATAADERSIADVAIDLSRRFSDPAALVLLALTRESIAEGGRGAWLSELGLARATRELDEDLGVDGTAHGFAELSRAGVFWTREEGVRLAVRRSPHALVKMPLTMREAARASTTTSSASAPPADTSTRGVRLGKGGAHG